MVVIEGNVKGKIAELVQKVQEVTAFGHVSSKYLCPVHKRFLKCEILHIEIIVGQAGSDYICDFYTKWICDECNKVIVATREE